MKKIMMMAMMAVTTTAFAQSDVVKNAKKLLDKGDVEEAIKAVQPARCLFLNLYSFLP